MRGPQISIRSLHKRFGSHQALDDVCLDIRPGELLVLVGPSGSGKTTLLRMIAGLDPPDEGCILLAGEDVTPVSAAGRGVGFVFQHYALFPHMTVAQNIAFGLRTRPKRRATSNRQAEVQVHELLALVELGGLGDRYPGELSGGQRQRVALSRALAAGPGVLLLDEPFGALDETVRRSLRTALRRIHDEAGLTTILVTHDQEEAMEVGDRMAVLNSGRIEQVGEPEAVYRQPATAFVCGFVGQANRFDGMVRAGHFTSGDLRIAAPGLPDGRAAAYVRPHDFLPAARGLTVKVERVALYGAIAKIDGRTADGVSLKAEVARAEGEPLKVGAEAVFGIRQAHLYPSRASE